LGLILNFGGPCGSYSYLSVGLISGPGDRSSELLRGKAYKWGGTLTLLAEDEVVEALV